MSHPTRPIIYARRGVVTSGHYLATAAGFQIMFMGGNAIDAAAAMCFCEVLVEPQNCGLGGEAPTLIYSAQEKKTYAISGMGWSPKEFTIEWCQKNEIDIIPGDGYLPACVPSVVGTWAEALARWGKLSFAEILQPAIQLAENGFGLYPELRNTIASHVDRFMRIYPSTVDIYCPNGEIPEVGDPIRNPDLAKTYRKMIAAEAKAKRRGRLAGLEAARKVFYQGEIAEQIVEYIHQNSVEDGTGKQHAGMLSLEDFAEWHAAVEEPVSYNYRGLDVYKCSSWTQGPVFLQQLSILEGMDLKQMGHNTSEYLHNWIECAKLAFADREAYYGDPTIDQVPFDILLAKEYGNQRRELIGSQASLEMRPGSVGGITPDYLMSDVLADNRLGSKSVHIGDTTHLDAIDAQGNMVASTPSGGWIPTSPVISGLGFPLGTRGQMFYLNPNRPNALQPHKRPRATLTPSLVMKNGKPFMVFGTPGGDSQDQWTLQFFLNYVDFDMDLQSALDAPTVHSVHFPSSFYPREAFPGLLEAESRIPSGIIAEMEKRGHQVKVVGGWAFGKLMAIRIEPDRGLIFGACSAKGNIGYAFGY
jgi:gamma-glutamyltranspeptidase/glutathione hydrolase